MKYRKDVLIARLVFVLLIVLVIGIIFSIVSRLSSGRQNQQQVQEVVEETERNEVIAVDNTEFAVITTETEETEEEEASYVKTTADVNFRQEPTTDGTMLATIPKGTEVELLGEDGGWSKVFFNNTEGYVNSNYVEAVLAPTEDSDITVMITTTEVRMREHPSSDSNLICNISSNSKLNVFEIANGWAKIYYNGQTGYVSAQYLREE